MKTIATTKDKNGQPVITGDIVRVIAINFKAIKDLTINEQNKLKSMIGEDFPVEEIDKYGSAWVSKWWHNKDGGKESHSLALSASEMEKVSNKNC